MGHQWGPREDSLRALAEAGEEIPALDNRPTLYDDLADIWSAFWELDRARPVGMGPSAIPRADVLAWLDAEQIRGDSRQRWFRLICEMDAVRVSMLREQLNASRRDRN